MKRTAVYGLALGLSLSLAPVAWAQPSGELAPQTRSIITPVAPPMTAVSKVGPGMFVVSPVPGLSVATTVKIQNFSDYDRNNDGVYNPMEFAQAIYFLATADPVAGNPKLPADDRFYHRGAPQTMNPVAAVALLNATADELAVADVDGDWRVSPAELASAPLM